jgi:hypothetical protein
MGSHSEFLAVYVPPDPSTFAPAGGWEVTPSICHFFESEIKSPLFSTAELLDEGENGSDDGEARHRQRHQ